MLIRFNRSSVSMGDDAEDHYKDVEVPDRALIKDLIVWALEGNYRLASVAGDVSWVAQIRKRTPGAAANDIALIIAPQHQEKRIHLISAHLAGMPLEVFSKYNNNDPLEIYFSYVSAGQSLTVEQFKGLQLASWSW